MCRTLGPLITVCTLVGCNTALDSLQATSQLLWAVARWLLSDCDFQFSQWEFERKVRCHLRKIFKMCPDTLVIMGNDESRIQVSQLHITLVVELTKLLLPVLFSALCQDAQLLVIPLHTHTRLCCSTFYFGSCYFHLMKCTFTNLHPPYS